MLVLPGAEPNWLVLVFLPGAGTECELMFFCLNTFKCPDGQSTGFVLLPGAAAECGATLSAGQPRGPRTLTYECRARDADTGAGRAGVATDGPAQCSTFATVAIAGWAYCNQWTEEAFVGRRLLDECRARDADTGAGRAGVPPMVPPGAVRSSFAWSNGRVAVTTSRHSAVPQTHSYQTTVATHP